MENELVKLYLNAENDLCEQNVVILRGERILLPKSLHQQSLKVAHEGHFGIEKCKSLLREKVYWLSMEKDIIDYVNKCVACQANIFKQTTIPISTSKLPEYPWSQIFIDFYGPLPSEQKLFVLIDMYSRYPIAKIMKNTSAQSVIRKFNKIYSIFGYPKKVLSDNGPLFQSDLFIKFYFEFLNIKHRKITRRYPQANGIEDKDTSIQGEKNTYPKRTKF